jgi:acyl carrier protein
MDIESTIERYILDEIMMKDEGTRIDPDQSLVASGVIDSLTLLRLIVFIEEQFDIKIDDDEVIPENFETINVIKSFVQSKM